jgi:thiol:disulfide interchange protein DsbC
MNFKTLSFLVALPLAALLWGIAGGVLVEPAYAQDKANAGTNAQGSTADAGQLLADKLRALRPDIPIESVSPTPLPGIYALELAGGTVFYGTEDGRYLFAGDLYELGETNLFNLSDISRAGKRQELMATVAIEDMVIFPATGDRKAIISVFTDVDCGFCQKLHREVPELNSMGIEVRYLAYPRAGVGSESYNKIVSAWCSADRNTAITKLKSGEDIPEARCQNPVAAQFDLGQMVGVTGTPAIVLEDGRLLPGYQPAAELAATIGL